MRCDGHQPRCANCAKRSQGCIFLDVRCSPKSINGQDNVVDNSLVQGEAQDWSTPGSSSQTPVSQVNRDGDSQEQVSRAAHTGFSDTDAILNTDSSQHRRKYLGGATLQALAQYLDRFFQHKGWDSIQSNFAFGMPFCEEMPIVMSDMLQPSLLPPPPIQECQLYLDLYFTKIHPMFPLFEKHLFDDDTRRLVTSELDQLNLKDVPHLISLYAALSLGIDEASNGPTELGWKYLQAAYRLHSFLVASPYVSSVQALMLIALALRARNKDGAAWHLIG